MPNSNTPDERAGMVERTPWLHIRGQFTYHSEATIKGTRTGLLALRGVIDQALQEGSAQVLMFASDGEGYEIQVTRSSTIAGLGEPTYADEEARELARMEREHLIRMDRILRKQDKEAMEALKWCRANGNPHAALSEGSE